MDGWTLRSKIRELVNEDGQKLVPDELYQSICEATEEVEKNERLLNAYKLVVGHMAR